MSSRIMCAKNVSVQELRDLADPKPLSPHHFPIRFDCCRDLLVQSVQQSGFKITGEEVGLSTDSLRAVGIIDLDDFGSDGAQTLFSWTCAHDMSLAFHVDVGDINRVCSNMHTFGDSVRVSRKNTRYAVRDLPRLVDRAVGQLVEHRKLQNHRIECYQRTHLTIAEGDSIILTGLKKRIIGRDNVLKVYDEWRNPSHWEFAMQRNAHRLLQAFTESFKEDDGSVNLPRLNHRCKELHGVLDGVCRVLS